MLIVFIGPPGAGKGTQAALLSERLGIPHISTGELLRRAKEDCTELGKLAAAYMDQGNLVPDEVIIGIIAERLAEREYQQGCLLDGFPRTVSQAEVLDAMLLRQGRNLDLVLELDCDDDEVVRRLLQRAKIEGRADDTPETISHRQHTYRVETEPVLDHYRDKGLLRTVNGMQSEEDVFEDVQAVIAENQAKS